MRSRGDTDGHENTADSQQELMETLKAGYLSVTGRRGMEGGNGSGGGGLYKMGGRQKSSGHGIK